MVSGSPCLPLAPLPSHWDLESDLLPPYTGIGENHRNTAGKEASDMQMCRAVLSFPEDSPVLPKIEPEEREERADCNWNIGMSLFNHLSHKRPSVKRKSI